MSKRTKYWSLHLRRTGLLVCFAMIGALVMENSVEAQRKRGRSGGGSQVQGGGGGGQQARGSRGHRTKKQKVKSHVKGQVKNRLKSHGKNKVKNHTKGQVRSKVRRKLNDHRFHNGHNHGNGHNHFGNNHHNRGGHNHWKGLHRNFHRHVHWHNHNWRHKHCVKVRANRSLCWTYTKWCGYYPTRCHWWYGYCGTNYYFDPTFSPVCEWTYYPVYIQGVVQAQYQWHLGMDCVYIPGLGYGVQEVQVGSPAALAGLAQGMIITSANGHALETETAMQELMQSTDGLLGLNVVADESGQGQLMEVQMARVPVSR